MRRSTKTTSRQAANNILTELLAHAKEGALGEATIKVTPFDDLVNLLRADYLRKGHRSWDRQEHAIKHLRESFAKLPAAAISFSKVSTYIEHRQRDGAASGTIHAEVACLRRMLKLAVSARMLRTLPVFPEVPKSQARQGYLTEGEIAAVVAALPQPIADLVQTLAITGWRRNEIQFLQWDHVDFRDGMIHLTVERSKTKEARVFPFSASPSLASLLQRRYDARREGTTYVFEKAPGPPVRDFRGAWRAACEKAGVPGRIPHDLRRSRARAMTRAGVPQATAMRLLGHKSPTVFLSYDVVAVDDLRRAVAAVERSSGPLCGTFSGT